MSDNPHEDLAECLKAKIAEAVSAERDACAKVIEEGQETIRETSDGSTRYLSPRNPGNQAGLAFAEAIRKRT